MIIFRHSYFIKITICLTLILMAGTASATVNVPSLFSNHMVLQRNAPVAVWGKADPGQKIAVSFAGHNVAATADKAGRWKIMLPAMGASAQGRTLTVKGRDNTLAIHDVLVGEVWLCSGQSNMEFPVRGWPPHSPLKNSKQVIAKANHPAIRLIDVPNKPTALSQYDFKGQWLVCSPDTVANFSAVGYFFALNLYKHLRIPIGVIEADWGGTVIQPWIPESGYRHAEKLQCVRTQIKKLHDQWWYSRVDYLHAAEKWVSNLKKNIGHRGVLPAPPLPPTSPFQTSQQAPTALFNGMIAPLIPYRIRGVAWYQGGSNANRHDRIYFYRLKALISSWRQRWGQGDFPFIIVQIAPYGGSYYGKGDEPAIWKAQIRAAQTIKNVGIVSTMDIGEQTNIHYQDKQDVGKRLALWARANVYGDKNLVYSGPIFASMQVDGNKVIIHFNHVGSGLAARGGKPLTGFKIEGKNGKFIKAKATIKNDSVVVQATGIIHPQAVSFAWSKTAVPALMNKEGLPALPFYKHK